MAWLRRMTNEFVLSMQRFEWFPITSKLTIVAVLFCSSVTASEAGFRAYITNGGTGNGNTVSVIDTTTGTVIATVTVGKNPTGVAVSPDGTKVYVGNVYDSGGGHWISVIDAVNNVEVGSFDTGPNPYGLAVTPDGKKLYVASGTADDLAVVDLTSNLVTHVSLPGGSGVGG